jgi:hypothetical protein
VVSLKDISLIDAQVVDSYQRSCDGAVRIPIESNHLAHKLWLDFPNVEELKTDFSRRYLPHVDFVHRMLLVCVGKHGDAKFSASNQLSLFVFHPIFGEVRHVGSFELASSGRQLIIYHWFRILDSKSRIRPRG